MDRRYIFIWAFLVFKVVDGTDDVSFVKYVTPNDGGSDGGQRLTIHGDNFPVQLELDSDEPNKEVFLKSSFNQYVCDIHQDESHEQVIVCFTRKMQPGKYYVRVRLNGIWLDDSLYCYDRNSHRTCSLTVSDWRAPLISITNWVTGEPQNTITLSGRIHTTLTSSAVAAAENGETATIVRVWLTSGVCELFNETDVPYGIALSSEESRWGYLTCYVASQYVGNQNISFIVDGAFGRSGAYTSTKHVSADNRIYMIQTYAAVTDVSPKEGSTLGGTKMTITGNFFDNLSGIDARVLVGGSECVIESVSDTEIICQTSATPPTRTLYSGGRGVRVEVFRGETDQNAEITTEPSFSFFQDHMHVGNINEDNYVSRMRGFFIPPTTGNYKFFIKADDGASLYVNSGGVDPAGKVEVVSSTSAEEYAGSDNIALEAGNEYYVEVRHLDETSSSHVHVKIYADTTNYTPEETASAVSDVQDINITSTFREEQQTITFQQWVNQTTENSVSTISLTCGVAACDGTFFKLSLLGVSTDPIPFNSDPSVVQAALSSLTSLGSDSVTVTGDDSSYEVTFGSTRGKMTVTAESLSDDLNIDVSETVVGSPDLLSFTFQVNGKVSESVAYDAEASVVANAVQGLFGPKCPHEIEQGYGQNIYQYNNLESGTFVSGERSSEESFCGIYSVKNPSYLFYTEESPISTSTYKELCFAYIGDISDHIRISYSYVDLETAERSEIQYLQYLYSVGLTNAATWTHICLNMDSLLLGVNPNKGEFLVYALYLTAGADADLDLFVDNIMIASQVAAIDKEAYIRRIRPSAVPDIRISGVTVTKEGPSETVDLQYQVTFHAIDCGNNFPLLGFAFADTSGVSADEVTYGSNWAATSRINVVRDEYASPPVTGSFSVMFTSGNHGSLSSVDADITEENFVTLLESLNEISTVAVSKGGTCYGYSWRVTFKSPGGKYPAMVPDGAQLVGREPVIAQTQINEGGLSMDPAYGDFFRIAHETPQVQVFINNVPSHCSGLFDGDSATSCEFEWTDAATPQVTGVSPINGNAGTSVTISGNGFDATSNTVIVGGVECVTSANSATSITCELGQSPGGQQSISVNVFDKGLAAISDGFETFTVTASVDSILPTSGSINGFTTVTIQGAGFDATSAVAIGSATCEVTAFAYDSITCVTSALAAGMQSVVVTTSEVAVTSTFQYEYTNTGVAEVTGITPATASVAGGTEVTMTGTNFGTDEGTVMIGSSSATISSWTDTEIVVVAPSLPPASYGYSVVIDPTGAATVSASDNTINYPFSVTSITTTSGSRLGGTTVTLEGTGLTEDVEIEFGGVPCNIETVTPTFTCITEPSTTTHLVTNAGSHPSLGIGYGFDPSFLEIAQGDAVTFRWSLPELVEGIEIGIFTTAGPVSKTYDNDGFQVAASISGSYTHRFASVGTYYYGSGCIDDVNTCEVFMRGTIKVVEATSSDNTLTAMHGGQEATYNSEFTFTFDATTTPVVNSIAPRNGTTDTLITVQGVGLTADSTVTVGGFPCAVDNTASSTTQVVCQIDPAGEMPVGVPGEVVVNVPGVGNALNEIRKYEDQTFVLLPLISSFSPSSGSLAGGTKLTIDGSGFNLASGSLSAVIDASSQLTCTIDSNESTYTQIVCLTDSVSEATSGDVLVTQSGLNAECSDTCEFGFTDAATPVVTARQDVISTDFQTSTLTFTGTGFGTDSSNVVIMVGPVACVTSSVSDTEIVCTVNGYPVGSNQMDLKIVGKGFSKFVNAADKEITNAANIASLSPPTGSINGGTELTISGNGFVDGSTQVTIGSQSLEILSITYSTIICRTQANVEGSVEVTVTSNGVTYDAQTFEFATAATPTITTISPESGIEGDEITITGNVFSTTTDDVTVNVGGVDCTVTSSSDTEIVCTLGAREGGAVDTKVLINGKGDSNTWTEFSYRLEISSFAPNTGSYGGSQTIIIEGQGFSENSIVKVCGAVCEGVSVSTTSFTCITPANGNLADGTTSCDVSVSNGDSSNTATTQYTYSDTVTPIISDVSPRRGGTGGGTELTITGSGFVSPSVVTIDGSVCDVSSETSTSITCTTNSHQGSIVTKIKVAVGTDGIATQDNADFHYIDRWSSIFTWGGTTVPTTQDFVIIQKGQTILLDTDTAVLKMLLIDGGELIFDDVDVTLSSENILIVNGGRLQIGTEEQPFTAKAQIVMYGHLRSPELPIYGAKTLGVRNGTLDMHGKHVAYTWSLLDATAAAGATQIVVQHPVHWDVGDLIVIASTGLRHSQSENELRRITAVSDDGRTLTLNASLTYEHLGITERFGDHDVEFRAEVGLLTRNIVFRGSNDHVWHDKIEKCEEGFNTGQFATQTCFQGRFGEEVGSDQFGASIMIHAEKADSGEAVARIEYVEVNYAGQAFRLGRYPIHWHLMGNVSGMYVRGCGIHQTFNRAVTIHGTHNLLVERNVIYDIMGGAFFIEDGIETQNVIQYNLAVFVRQSTSLLNDDVTPAAYWVTNPDNVLRHNHAAGGTHFGFWYRMHEHPDGPSFTPDICQQNVELGQFENNTVHSQGWFGLWIFQTYTPVVGGGCDSTEPSPAKFKSLTTWNCEKGAEWVNCGAIQFHDFVMVNNEVSGMDLKLIKGTSWGEENGALIKDSVIVGHSNIVDDNYETGQGITLPFGPGLTVSNVEFHNFNRRGAAFGLTSIQGTCTFKCGGFYYWLEGLQFHGVTRKVHWRWEHEGVLEDRDGSFTGGPAFTKVVPSSGLYDPSKCIVQTGLEYSSALPSAICDPEVRFHRFAVNNILPSSLEANDLIFRSPHGNTSITYLKKRLTHKPGYMGLLPGKEDLLYTFKDGEQFTNITYNSRFYDFMNDDYLIITHKLKQRPDKITINNEERFEIGNAPDLAVETASNLDWSYNQDTKDFKYIVSGQTSSRKRRAAIEVVDDNFSHTTVSPNIYRCFYENCTAPPDPSQVPPDRERLEPFFLWSEENPCVNRTDPNNIIILSGTDDVEICWVVIDVAEITVDSLVVNGVLEFDTSTTLSAITILVYGRVIAGFSDTDYIGHDVTILLRGNHDTPAVALPGVNLGSKALGCFGGCDFHGRVKAVHWTQLETTAIEDDTTIELRSAVDWNVGDHIVITTTGYQAIETEKNVITSISDDGLTIGLQNPLEYRHLGESYSINGHDYDMRAEVGLLTHNIKIIGEEYTEIDAQAFGARVLVGQFRSGEVTVTGWARFSNVEFHRTGQEGWTDPWDPRFSLAWLNTGTVTASHPSYVTGCSFHDGYSTAIGTFGANGIHISHNVVHRTIHDGIRITGSNHRLEHNLVSMVLFRGAYNGRVELTNFKDWQANFEVSEATNVVLIDNAASGGERLCYHIDGEACDAADDENAWSGNIAHGCLHGIQIFLEDGIGSCSMIRNFVVYKAWDYGIYHQTSTSVVVRNTVIVDSTIGYMPLIFGPPGKSHVYEDKFAKLENVLCVGRSASFDPARDFMDEINDGNLLNRLNSPSRKSPRTPTGGSTCVMLPLFQSGPNGAPFKPFQLNKNYPAIHGLLNISGLTAYSYKAHGTARDLVFFTNPSNEDAFHPTYLKAITLVDVEQESKVLLDRPSLGKVNPSDCVDMECDAKKKVLIKDLDGSFLGGVGAVIPEAEFGWDDPEEISRGLGDYRVPKTMVTATDGSRFDVSDIADHRGIIRSDDCVYNSAWQAYDCHGPNARDYAMLVVESLDEDTETRRLSPVALLGDKYMDLNNGPQDHGWCFGYTCQKRLSTFFMIVATGVHYDMFMTGYPPRNLRFHLLNVDESKTIRIALYVPRPERLDIYRDISHLLIQPQNAYYDTEGEFWGRRAPSADNPDGYKPAIDSTVNGANFMDPATRLLYVTLRGSEPIEIVTVPLVLITFQVQAVSIDDFFGKNIISNLATFLDVPLSKIRMVDIVRETQQSRRKRQIQTYEVTLEFGDEVQNDTNINTTVTLTAEQLNELTDRVLLEFQQGTIFRVVNATVIGMSTQTAATNTTDYTEDVIVHKVPSALSIQHSRTVEELTAFPEVLTVSLIDDAGDVVTTLGGQWMITVELDKTGSNADPLATLSGETTVAVSNGSAVFSDLTISHAGQGYILRFRVSQPADITIGEHTELVDVTQRVVQPVFTSGIGTLYNHGDDVLMTLQLRDSSGQLLQNIDHKGLTWHATVSLDDNAIYGSSAVTGSTTFTFDTSTGTVTTTGLKISNTRSYHKYNVLFRIHTTPEPAAYDMSLSAEPIQFHDSSTDNIHEGLAATQSVKLLIMGRPYTTTRMETFKVYMYNILTDVIIGGNNRVSDGGAYIGSLDVADTTDVNTEVTFDINARSNDDVLQAVEGLTTYINGSPNLMFDGNAIQFSESQCGLTVCVVTTTSTTSTTASTSTVSTTTTTAPSSGSESDSTWIIIGVAIGLSIVLAAGAIGLACYLKRYPRSKVAPCIGGSQASLGSKSLMDSIPTESPSGTPSSDGLYHRPRSGMTPVHV